MHHAFGVCRGQRFGDLLGEFQNPIHRHLRVVANDVLQILALHVGHGNETQTRNVAHVVDAQNIFVGNFAGENQFLLETLQRVGLPDCAFAHHLDRHRAIEVLVVGLVHPAHAALPQQSFNAISRSEIAPGSDDGRIHHLDRFGFTHRHGRPAA